MEEALMQNQNTTMDKSGSVILDIESLTQSHDKCCCGSPKMTKALSRKGSNRMERRTCEDQESEDTVKKLVVKVPSQLDQLKQPLVPSKNIPSGCPALIDCEGRNKRFNRLTTIHPREILLIFATLSSMGTMILIYFTLAVNRKSGA